MERADVEGIEEDGAEVARALAEDVEAGDGLIAPLHHQPHFGSHVFVGREFSIRVSIKTPVASSQ